MKIIAGIFVIVATILAQIVSFNIVVMAAPAYLTLYIVAVVFTWVGLILSAISSD